MDDIKRKKISDLSETLKQVYNSLSDLAGRQDELLQDALDSLGEAISCIEEAAE